MNNEKEKNKPVIVTVFKHCVEKHEDFFTKLSRSAHRDQSYLRQVLKGKRNITVSVLQDIGSAIDMRYIMSPVPESPALKRILAGFAVETDNYWKIPLEKGYDALFSILLNAAGNKDNFKEICKAAYMFNAILARAASINGSQEDLAKMLTKDTEELLELIWRLTHRGSGKEQNNL